MHSPDLTLASASEPLFQAVLETIGNPVKAAQLEEALELIVAIKKQFGIYVCPESSALRVLRIIDQPHPTAAESDGGAQKGRPK